VVVVIAMADGNEWGGNSGSPSSSASSSSDTESI
jgi:hypothetical protein